MEQGRSMVYDRSELQGFHEFVKMQYLLAATLYKSLGMEILKIIIFILFGFRYMVLMGEGKREAVTRVKTEERDTTLRRGYLREPVSSKVGRTSKTTSAFQVYSRITRMTRSRGYRAPNQ